MKPTCIEDIVALVALYRPGPMENIPTYCEVKNGLKRARNSAPVDRPYPRRDAGHHRLPGTGDADRAGDGGLQPWRRRPAAPRHGQEDPGGDGRRAAEVRRGAAKNGVDEKKALRSSNLLDKFANYGFNKSHAAAYAVVSYQTAWLKANHPVEFMAGVMNCDIHLTDKLGVYAEEVRRGWTSRSCRPA
jgi:DNA polymerase-3 subunit alpha